jgi:hypothetical protein
MALAETLTNVPQPQREPQDCPKTARPSEQDSANEVGSADWRKMSVSTRRVGLSAVK